MPIRSVYVSVYSVDISINRTQPAVTVSRDIVMNEVIALSSYCYNFTHNYKYDIPRLYIINVVI